MAIKEKTIKKELEKNKTSHSYMRKRITKTQVDLENEKRRIKEIEESISPKSPRPIIGVGKNKYSLKKAIINPEYDSKTVLTDSTWSYVEIYLKGQKNEDAITYWNQARNFYEATQKLSLISKPLTSYYCMLNATKALLKHRNVGFNLKHGVSGKKVEGHYKLQNEQVTIQPMGVLSGLCSYMKETVDSDRSKETYTLKDIFYNIEYIHRAYMLTYNNQPELFIPIENPKFVFDKYRKKGWFQFELESSYSNKETMSKLSGYGVDMYYPSDMFYTIRKNKTFDWSIKHNKPESNSHQKFENYYYNVRSKLRYIYSPEKLWYIKRTDVEKNIISHNSLTLSYAAMHRLSEMSRYDPNGLQKHLDGKESWLLTEFMNKSIMQFIDTISSEITGNDFRVTGFRT